MTPELEREGLARDLVRLVQQARRDAGLAVSDRIALTISAGPDWLEALRVHETLVSTETLALRVIGVLSTTDSPLVEVQRVERP